MTAAWIEVIVLIVGTAGVLLLNAMIVGRYVEKINAFEETRDKVDQLERDFIALRVQFAGVTGIANGVNLRKKGD